MDYLKFVEHHRETDADITLGCLPCDDERAQDFGLMKINDEGDVIVSASLALAAPLKCMSSTTNAPANLTDCPRLLSLCATRSNFRGVQTLTVACSTCRTLQRSRRATR